MRLPGIALLAALLAGVAQAQSRPAPRLEYTLSVDEGDTTGVAVSLRIHHAPDTLRLAMPAHPEYDLHFYRNLRDLRVEGAPGAQVVRTDSALWRVAGAGEEPTLRYRLELGPAPSFRGSWVPFLAANGGLIGGPYGLLYPVGGERSPARLTLHLPAGWGVATGLESTGEQVFAAPDFATLNDSPLLVGRFQRWSFSESEVPHQVAYWTRAGTAPVDSAALVGALRALAREARGLMGFFPYRRFAFLLLDAAYEGLEHPSSVTIGVTAQELAGDRSTFHFAAAHEYFHTWNEVHLRPAGWGGLSWVPEPQTRELWWTEGVTIYYANLLLRRAGLATGSRQAQLEGSIAGYLDNPGSARISPERASWTSNLPPGSNGDLQADVFQQGELIAHVLDLAIRDSTAGRFGLDEVMRRMARRFAPPRGFTGVDVERTAGEVCGCALHGFFERHVRGAQLLDFAGALRSLGLRPVATVETVADSAGTPYPDLRVWAWVPRGGSGARLLVNDPRSAWARAGLHTGDRVIEINGVAIAGMRTLRTALSPLHIGDRARVVLAREGGQLVVTVPIERYSHRVVRLEDLPTVTPAQRARRERWLAGRW